jgi:hypothetical protein
MLYSPPEGSYDQPFVWVYNATGIVAGQDLLNQQVPMNQKTGDFVMRRVVGLASIVTGQFQLRDEQGSYIEQSPVKPTANDDLAIVPEITYPWDGSIRFDLYELI